MKKGKLTKENVNQIISLYEEGCPIAQLARAFGVDHSTVHYHLNKNGVSRDVERQPRVYLEPNDEGDVYVIKRATEGRTGTHRPKKPTCYRDYLVNKLERMKTKLQSDDSLNSDQRMGLRSTITYYEKTISRSTRQSMDRYGNM